MYHTYALYNLGDVLAILTQSDKLQKKMQFREAGPTIFSKDCKLMKIFHKIVYVVTTTSDYITTQEYFEILKYAIKITYSIFII